MERMNREELSVVSQRGKWSQPGVPHHGWTCVGIEDLGKPQMDCEMCESRAIRYVHNMEHPDYPQVLRVGCVCAGYMEGNPAAARGRESKMRSRVGKRKRWLTRRWRTFANGHAWIRSEGFSVTVYRRGGLWGAVVSAENGPFKRHLPQNYPSSDEAKLAAFDLITRLLFGREP